MSRRCRCSSPTVALVCAARTGIGDHFLAGVRELPVLGLGTSDARALLLDNVHGPLDAAVCDQIVAESHGNPLALLELPRTWSAADLAGGFGLPESQPVPGKIEQSYTRRLVELPPDTQLLVLAAADDRHRVHRALAEATDDETDPDRRAWHRARATPGPDEDVAADLERSAGRAQARGGVAAAAAFLQRAVALTVDPARRAERALAAAQASFQAGGFEAALGLLATAGAGPLDELQRAQVDLVRGRVAFASGLGGDAPRLLLHAARRLEPIDLELARETYLAAWGAVGQVGGSDVLLEVCRAVQVLPPPLGAPRPLDLLLDGLALLTTDGHAAAAPTLQRAGKVLSSIPVEDVLRWGWMATAAYTAVWGTGRAIRRSPPDRSGLCATPGRSRSCRSTSPTWARRACGRVTSAVPPPSWRRPTAWRRRPGATLRPMAW
jgi:hypothetical protein